MFLIGMVVRGLQKLKLAKLFTRIPSKNLV
jgi:hypothetical protein